MPKYVALLMKLKIIAWRRYEEILQVTRLVAIAIKGAQMTTGHCSTGFIQVQNLKIISL